MQGLVVRGKHSGVLAELYGSSRGWGHCIEAAVLHVLGLPLAQLSSSLYMKGCGIISHEHSCLYLPVSSLWRFLFLSFFPFSPLACSHLWYLTWCIDLLFCLRLLLYETQLFWANLVLASSQKRFLFLRSELWHKTRHNAHDFNSGRETYIMIGT